MMPNGRAQRVCGKRSLKRIRCNLFRKVVAAPVVFKPERIAGRSLSVDRKTYITRQSFVAVQSFLLHQLKHLPGPLCLLFIGETLLLDPETLPLPPFPIIVMSRLGLRWIQHYDRVTINPVMCFHFHRRPLVGARTGDPWQPNDAGQARCKASPAPAGSAFILS